MEKKEDKKKENKKFPLQRKYNHRPPKFDTPEQLYNKGMEYFESVTSATGIIRGTISGLTRYCGFSSRASWNDYAKKSEEFKHVVDSLRLVVIEYYERNLHSMGWAGSAFALRNMDSGNWKDEVTQNQNQVITNVTPTVIDTGVPLAGSEKEVK